MERILRKMLRDDCGGYYVEGKLSRLNELLSVHKHKIIAANNGAYKLMLR